VNPTTDLPILVALSPAGDVVVTSRYGRHWVHQPLTEPRQIDTDKVERFIDSADLLRVGQQYESWAMLEADIQRRVRTAPTVPVDTTHWDAVDVRDMLKVARVFEAEAKVPDARSLLQLLAGLPVVRGDDSLHKEVIDALGALVAPRVIAREFVSKSAHLVPQAMSQLSIAA